MTLKIRKKSIPEAEILLKELDSNGIYDLNGSDAEFSVNSEEGEVPDRKKTNFEFSDSYVVIRVIRIICYLQILALAIDNDAVQLPILFRIIGSGPLFYSIRFYSRPFVDLAYLVQYLINYYWIYLATYWDALISGRIQFGTSTDVNEYSRRLGNSDYAPVPPKEVVFSADIDFINSRNWHSIQQFSHYLLGILFAVGAVLFTFNMWIIKDYSDRMSILAFLTKYIKGGWWKRGGLNVVKSILYMCLSLSTLFLVIFAIARGMNVNALPDARIIGSFVASITSVTLSISIIAYTLLNASHSAFAAYVSQNMAYVSVIILKKVIKVKTELGIGLMILVYTPVVYNLTQAVIYVLDWNDTIAPPFRRSYNYYTPCYIMAFPPLTVHNMDKETCKARTSYATSKWDRFDDQTILSCDSYLGVFIFTVSCISLGFMLVGYNWLLFRIINSATSSIKDSRWASRTKSLSYVLQMQWKSYNKSFNVGTKYMLAIQTELRTQCRFIVQMTINIADLFIYLCQFVIATAIFPYYLLRSPINFIRKRLCSAFVTEGNSDEAADASIGTSSADRLMSNKMIMEEKQKKINDLMASKRVQLADDLPPSVQALNMLYGAARKYLPLDRMVAQVKYLSEVFSQSSTISTMRLNVSLLTTYLCCGGSAGKEGSASVIASIGTDKHANWRLKLNSSYQYASLKSLEGVITREFNTAKIEFILDHSLDIVVFDTPLDNAGLAFLVCPFEYTKSGYLKVFVIELCVYAVGCPILNFSLDWISRLQLVIVVNVAFGAITYVICPYSNVTDRWLEFFGRVMICSICVIILAYHSIVPAGVTDKVHVPMYAPWKSYSYLANTNILNAALYVTIDAIAVLVMYTYIAYILKEAGVFDYIRSKIASLRYVFHDIVFDFLTEQTSNKTIGVQNIYTGIAILTQWDEIIREQRRYALLLWPDIRPKTAMGFVYKLLHVKWASFFNLTIENMRSSLGLTLLHSTMCQGNGEMSRFILHYYPELMRVEDSQRDTPIAYALKECAFYLINYGLSNDGKLDDNTGYDDETYYEIYPEIFYNIDQTFTYGEYVKEVGNVYDLNSTELLYLDQNGYFRERDVYEPSFQDKIEIDRKVKQAKNSRGQKLRGNNGPATQEMTDEEKEVKYRYEQTRAKQIEKTSFYGKRFPEDDALDDHEMGGLSAWNIIGFNIPNVNLFIDPDDIHAVAVADEHNERDRVYAIDTCKSILEMNDDIAVPYDTDAYQSMGDWYSQPSSTFLRVLFEYAPVLRSIYSAIFSKKRLATSSNRGDDQSAFAASSSVSSADYSRNSNYGIDRGKVLIQGDKQIRYKMCLFADVLLSDDIAASCRSIEWDTVNYKAFNLISDENQGRLAQHLAMACNLKPPPRFSRISEWSMGITVSSFDEYVTYVNPVEMVVLRVTKIVDNISKQVSVVSGQLLNRLKSHMRGSSSSSNQHDATTAAAAERTNNHNNHSDDDANTSVFNDRIVQYLAECIVSSSDSLELSDCELSQYGKSGWRAISRACRRKNCTFILPSIFVSPKTITIRHIDLSRNELHCGDAILIGEILQFQQTIQYCNLSFNRIGSRGMTRISKVLKDHESISTFIISNNRIGPACGKDIRMWLQTSKSIKVLDLSCNRLGELIRYPTPLNKESIPSAANDIFWGIKKNVSLEVLNISYNCLGPSCADIIPLAVNGHPRLYSLNLSGNSIGEKRGAQLIFALAGEYGGDKLMVSRLELIAQLKQSVAKGIDVLDNADKENSSVMKKGTPIKRKNGDNTSPTPGSKKMSGNDINVSDLIALSSAHTNNPSSDGNSRAIPSQIVDFSIADNQLGELSGHAIAAFMRRNRNLTALNLSGNALGLAGGLAVTEGIEKIYGILPSTHLKQTIAKIDDAQYVGRNCKKRPKLWTNLTHLNMCRNGLGPDVLSSIMICLAHTKCTLTNVDLSDNPLGYSINNGGYAHIAATNARVGMAKAKTLRKLSLRSTYFQSAEIVPMIGGLSMNLHIQEIDLSKQQLDEPTCLQLAHAIGACKSLHSLSLYDCNMGSKGSVMVCNRIDQFAHKILYLNLSGNKMGPTTAISVAKALVNPACSIRTLKLADNDLFEIGGRIVADALAMSGTITDLDLSNNGLTASVAEILAQGAYGYYENGVKVIACSIKYYRISNNPLIGAIASRSLLSALQSSNFEHIEIANIGLGYNSATTFATAVRDVVTNWKYVDIGGNNICRSGLNTIFWAMRQNRSIRVLLTADNKAGPEFATTSDSLLKHGIAFVRMIRSNVVLRELDLSYNGISADAGNIIFDAMIDNYSIRHLTLRGNHFDDTNASALGDLIRLNNVIDYLDLGENKLGYECSFSIAEGIEVNRSIRIMCLDNNLLGNAGAVTASAFSRAIMMNTSLQTLVLDGNKLGPDWGINIAKAISRNNTLIQVSLRDNRLDHRAGMALYNSYTHATNLIDLALTADELGDDMWHKYQALYAKRRSIIGPNDTLCEHEIYVYPNEMIDAYGR